MTNQSPAPAPTPGAVRADPTAHVTADGRHWAARPTRSHAIRRLLCGGLRAAQALAAAVIFAATVTAANWLTAHYGLLPVGFGLTAAAGAYGTGFCLLARDWIHDTVGRAAVLIAIAAGTLACAATTGPRLAVASTAAFVLSEVADLLVYQPLRRHGVIPAVLASNAVGATVDTLLLGLARHSSGASVAGQLLALATATAVAVVLLATREALAHQHWPDVA